VNVKAFVLALVALVIAGLLMASVIAYSIVRRGLSTRVEPSRIETLVARTTRRLATPSDARARTNPVPATKAALDDGLEHFADHCATCHANDGSGNTSIGRSFYPPVPDMRASATQLLSDGELFSIIENGIRLTGMPAWGTGTPEGEQASWALVHFIRRLPTLTADEVERMEQLNPRSPEEFRQDEAARRFLAGDDSGAADRSASSPGHRH
jgi:mono/diheme cytochrome c family protein